MIHGYQEVEAAAKPHFDHNQNLDLYVGVAGLTVDRLVNKGSKGTRLSEREREVIKRIALGKTSQQISEELEIVHRTTESYITNILRKLGAKNRAEAVAVAIKLGEMVI